MLHRVLVVVTALALLTYGVRVLSTGPLGGEAVPLAGSFVLLAGLAVVRALRAGRRPEDLLLAVGLGLSAAGWTYWALVLTPMADPPYPSPADALWMSLHLCAVLALAWHVGATWRARGAFSLDELTGLANRRGSYEAMRALLADETPPPSCCWTSTGSRP